MTDMQIRLNRLARLLAAARSKEAVALGQLGRSIAAEADASARRNRILGLIQETTPLVGPQTPAALGSAAQLRTLLAPAKTAAASEIARATSLRISAQQQAEAARARTRRVADILNEARRDAATVAERRTDNPARKIQR